MKQDDKIKIIVMGGGTGTFTVLSGLKNYSNIELTAVITSADDGGSNKKFRDEFGLLPPSDFRQCLIALSSDDPSHTTMRKLFLYRFDKGLGLEGQTFGNIFIAALTEIEGSQLKAFEEIGKILKIKGNVVPITLDDVRLVAEYENGEIVFGEHLIDEPEAFHNSDQKIKKLFLNRKAEVYQKAKDIINESDFIVMGPGDLYTSTLANVVVGDAADLIKNSKTKIIFVVNLMTKKGQTSNFTAKDHVEEIKRYVGRYPDYILINNAPLPSKTLKVYEKAGDFEVKDDLEDDKYKVVRKDLLSYEEVKKSKADKLFRSLIRHDSNKIAEAILDIINSSHS